MIELRRTDPSEAPDPEDARTSRRQRAFDHFAAWLERHDEPRELDERSFTELLQEHPDLQDELRSLRAGLEKFRGLKPSRLRAALDATPRIAWRRIVPRVAAAALVVVLAGVVWRLARPPLATTPAPPSPLAAAVIARGVEWLDEKLKKGGEVDSIRRRIFVAAGSDAARAAENPLLEQVTTAAVRASAGVYSIVAELESSASAAANAPDAPTLASVRETLVAAEPVAWRATLLKSLDTPEEEFDPAAPFLFALRQDPAIRALLAASTPAERASEATARLIAGLTKRAVLRVRAIDLDAGGREFIGATVYAQPVELPGNEVGAPIRLGTTPLAPCGIDCGDWRITLVDATAKEPRISEVRLLAAPGEDLGLRVLFLRATASVTEKMAFREAATFRFGKPPNPKPNVMDLPETTAELGEFWIDPYEVTCAQYSDFYLDLRRHPEWFDGVVPVRRPDLLAEDGTCPRAFRRRPIVGVTWREAVLYANWAGKRLPTEREWERVARGTEAENRTYPWGDKFSPERINDSGSSIKNFRPGKKVIYEGVEVIPLDYPPFDQLVDGEVDSEKYLDGGTPVNSGDRVFRMADNASEYVEDLYVEGAASSSPSLHYYKTPMRVEKGSNWMLACESLSTTWFRLAIVPDLAMRVDGFRCVKTAAPTVTKR